MIKKIIVGVGILVVVFVAVNIITNSEPKRDPELENVARSNEEGKILFVRKHDDGRHIHIMNADGTDVVDLVNCFDQECYPTWSPDGKKILFQRQINGVATYVMDANGKNVKRLSPTPALDVRPSWSPDGKKIIFNRIYNPPKEGDVPEADIMIMNADGSGAYTILPITKGHANIQPRFSPDGKKITFQSIRLDERSQHIYVMDIDGSNVRRVTDKGANGDPVWSPDGSRIAFGSNRAGAVNVFTAKSDGSDVKQITHFDHPYEGGDTSWSPDGKKIAFQWDVGGKGQSDPNVPAEVWIVNSDGSGEPVSTKVSCSSVGCAPRWQFGTP